MNHTKLATITMLLLFVAALAVAPVYAATVTVTPNKSAYVVGDALTVSGAVTPVAAGNDVSIIIKDPSGANIFFGQATPAASGSYSATVGTFAVGQASGIWTVQATYQGAVSTSSFTLAGVQAATPIVPTVNADAGDLYFAGETATIFVLTSNAGVPVDGTITAMLYPPTGTPTALNASSAGTGIARISWTVPSGAAGTYGLVVTSFVNTSTVTGTGVAIKSFTISPTLSTMGTTISAMNLVVTSINNNYATLSNGLTSLTTSVNNLGSSITSISNGIASIQTNFGTINTKLDTIDAVLGAVAGDTTTLKTSVGTITTSLSSLDTKVTALSGNLATVSTAVGTLQGTVTSVSNNVATIQTAIGTMQADLGTLKTDVADAKTATLGLSPLIIVAIVLALVAAIAAIASIVLMRRKIAG